jgi:organic hydroperoxide reductase OsmC/OhrA
MEKHHHYKISMHWTGNTGSGTTNYRSYERAHEIFAGGKPPIPGSSDPTFRGDPSRYNPEELLVAALSACHMLWYLHLCALSNIVVVRYEDEPTGQMMETADGGGRFREVILHPRATVRKGADLELCKELHEKSHALCFIANSVNFPVKCEPQTEIED